MRSLLHRQVYGKLRSFGFIADRAENVNYQRNGCHVPFRLLFGLPLGGRRWVKMRSGECWLLKILI